MDKHEFRYVPVLNSALFALNPALEELVLNAAEISLAEKCINLINVALKWLLPKTGHVSHLYTQVRNLSFHPITVRATQL